MATPSSPKPFTVGIIGGGITGVVLAIALHQRSIPFKIYEQSRGFREIGAGLAFHPNVLRALEDISPRLKEAFSRVATPGAGAPVGGRAKFFDFIDGTKEGKRGEDDKANDLGLVPEFTPLFPTVEGPRAVHRAKFLDEMLKCLPEDAAVFGKRLVRIEDEEGKEEGRVRLYFEDGTTQDVDAVVGCNGIKSRTREIVAGPDAQVGYAHMFTYRALIPMGPAIEALGKGNALKACIWMGPDMHVTTYPVDQGRMLNFLAYTTDPNDWPSDTQLVLPGDRDEMVRTFEGKMASHVVDVVKLPQKVDRYALFDLADHPPSTFHKGRVVILGDAGHAATSHMGVGAGMGVEDVAVLSGLLADITRADQIPLAFKVYDSCRRERCEFLVRRSRWAGDVYQFRRLGRDFDLMAKECQEGQDMIALYDVAEAVREAKEELKKLLG